MPPIINAQHRGQIRGQRRGQIRSKVRSLLARSHELGPAAFVLFARAFACLLTARIALRLLPVARIIAWKQQAFSPTALTEQQAAEIRARVRYAVLIVARYSPVRFVCFPQCLAAAALLRSSGLASRLHYGVARDDGKLITHTWLESGSEIVIGGEVAANYSTLAVY